MARVTGEITIDGVKYPIENFTIEWHNDLQSSLWNGSNLVEWTSPYIETAQQRDKRLNPRKYDYCKWCDHYRYRHESNYGKCTGIEWGDEMDEECDCKEFV